MTVEATTQHVKGNDGREAIITEEPNSHLRGLLRKEDKKKEQGDFGRGEEHPGLRGERERDWETEKKSY